jgi:hypothetical protein
VHKPEIVGASQRIPVVIPATDILTSAQMESRNVPPTKGILHFIALILAFSSVVAMTFHIAVSLSLLCDPHVLQV